MPPDLDEIAGRILQRDWRGGPRSKPPEPDENYKLVEDGALVIFDGLDEVLVHLTPNPGRAFTRQLFRTVPPNTRPFAEARGDSDASRNRKGVTGRLLSTCRTHYFMTV
jgi:hypothetical protein